MIAWLAGYVAVGAFVGFLAGLLGIGGGMTLVPILAALFVLQGLAPETTVHLALGTAMAQVIFTSAAGAREHHRHAAVDWTIVRRLGPAMAAGALASTLASGLLPQRVLALAFAAIVFAGATQILFGGKPSAHRTLPGWPGMLAAGLVIGVICGLVSAGGAFLTVPFMLFCGVTMHTAIGTGAALGIPVAVVGAIGYAVAGWHAGDLPPYSVGFIYLPALAGIVVASIVTAPWGARLAHRLPVQTLKRIFAALLYALATKMVVSYW